MSDAVEQVRQRLLRAAHALETSKVPYAVVGGNAVAAWVSTVDESAVRNTRDVDILLRLSDLEAATAALSAVGFVHRRTLQQRTDFFKLLLADVAGVTVSHHDIFASIGKILNMFFDNLPLRFLPSRLKMRRLLKF